MVYELKSRKEDNENSKRHAEILLIKGIECYQRFW
jgi:hypothetical protein